MWKLFIDDTRKCPEGWFHIRTVNHAIFAINLLKDQITHISLDHDAGEYVSQGGDYIKILDWLEVQKQVYGQTYMDNYKFSLHTGNPVGYTNMWRILQKNGWTEIELPEEIEEIINKKED